MKSRARSNGLLDELLIAVDEALEECGDSAVVTLSVSKALAEYLRSSLGLYSDGERLDRAFAVGPVVGRPRNGGLSFEEMIAVHRIRTENPGIKWKEVAVRIKWGDPETLKATYHKYKHAAAAASQVLDCMHADRNKTDP